MAQRFRRNPVETGTGYPIIGANSIQFTVADPVVINSSGFLDLATSSTKIYGYALDTVLMSASNQTVAKVCPQYTLASPSLEVVYPSASTAFAQTNVGEYYVLSGTTSGSFTINPSSSATVGQFLCVGFNPENDGTTTDGVFVAAARATDTTVS